MIEFYMGAIFYSLMYGVINKLMKVSLESWTKIFFGSLLWPYELIMATFGVIFISTNTIELDKEDLESLKVLQEISKKINA